MPKGTSKKATTRKDYLAERKRVDDFINARLAEQRSVQTQQSSKFDYPFSIAVLGKGFRNLYDVLRGQSIK